jgi:hypothetical protein
MDFILRPVRPAEGSDDLYIAFLASLTDEERAVVDRDALALTRQLILRILAHSEEHPHVPTVVWLHAVNALFEALHGMITEGAYAPERAYDG